MTGKRMRYTILGRNVLAVAKEGAVNDWTAYIDAVPGINHQAETEHVMRHGDKLQEKVARVLFPEFHDLAWRR